MKSFKEFLNEVRNWKRPSIGYVRPNAQQEKGEYEWYSHLTDTPEGMSDERAQHIVSNAKVMTVKNPLRMRSFKNTPGISQGKAKSAIADAEASGPDHIGGQLNPKKVKRAGAALDSALAGQGKLEYPVLLKTRHPVTGKPVYTQMGGTHRTTHMVSKGIVPKFLVVDSDKYKK